MKRLLRVLLTPGCWLQNHRYNKNVEAWWQSVRHDPKIEFVDAYHACINGKIIWIANYPYAMEMVSIGCRPSRASCLEIWDAVDKVRLS